MNVYTECSITNSMTLQYGDHVFFMLFSALYGELERN